MGEILVGTSSWTDPTLIASGWYPRAARTPEARLAHYASVFPLVEVDSSYYALPSERNAALWALRTPADFTFNVKAYSLLTGHPTRAESLPKDLRAAAGDKRRVYPRDLPKEVLDEVWEMFRSALMPLHSAGKLGAVLFQFPEWVHPSAASKAAIVECAERLPDYRVAVEFRQRAWMEPEDAARRTLAWLAGHDLVYVCVDMPQGFLSSVPAVVVATAEDLAIVRFHGRNTETWAKPRLSAAERFDYSYAEGELREWVPKVRALASEAKRAHVLFNNCYRDKGVRNAQEMMELLGAPPVD